MSHFNSENESTRLDRRRLIRHLALGGALGLSWLAAEQLGEKRAYASGLAARVTTPDFDDLPELPNSPGTPPAGYNRLHARADKHIHTIDDSGVDTDYTNSKYRTASYIIRTDGTYYYAINGVTGAVDYGGSGNAGGVSGSDAALVICNAINALAEGGKVFIKAGTYVLASLNVNMGGSGTIEGYAAIGSTSVNNIELCGEGNATILRADTNLNGTIVGISGVNGWTIHDMQIDGNRANQSGSGAGPGLMGVDIQNSEECTVCNCYVRECKTYGILLRGANCRIAKNDVVNCNANGISCWLSSVVIMRDNVVNGASDVGIDINGDGGAVTDILCEGNIVQAVNLGVSPFRANSGIGIMVGDYGNGVRVTVQGNIVDACSGYGIASYPTTGTMNKDILIDGNQIYSCVGGIEAFATTGLIVKGNIIDGTSSNNINLGGDIVNVTVEGNVINSLGAGCTAVFSQASAVKIIENTIIASTSASDSTYGINNQGSGCTISSNTADLTATSAAKITGIYASGNNLVVMMNTILGNPTNGSSNYNGLQDNASNSVYVGNMLKNIRWYSLGIGNLYSGNGGINPIGKISKPFNAANNTIGVNGETSTPSKSTAYTAQGSNLIITSTGGSNVSIVIRDPSGNSVLSGNPSTLSGQLLPFGYTIDFGAYSSAPTVTVFGE